VSTKRPFRVSRGVVRDRQQPGKDRVAVNPDLISSSPSLEKDDARQIFCRDQEPVKRKQWLYTDFEWRSKSSANAAPFMGAYLRQRSRRIRRQKSFSRLLNVRQAVESFK